MIEALIAVAAAVVLLLLLTGRKRKPRYLSITEYWVYLPGETLPKQEAVMDRMLRSNPHPGAPIGPSEALLFSDVRLHIALVLRRKNAQVFRPDLFGEDVNVSAEKLAALAAAKSFAKIQFVSEEPLKDSRHLQFMPHAADAVADLGGAEVIYDLVAEQLLSASELRQALHEDRDATRAELHARILWRRTAHGGIAETRGLKKVGLHELSTDEMDVDQQVLVKDILEEAIEALWRLAAMPSSVEVVVFGDVYTIEIRDTRQGPAKVTIMKTGAVD